LFTQQLRPRLVSPGAMRRPRPGLVVGSRCRSRCHSDRGTEARSGRASHPGTTRSGPVLACARSDHRRGPRQPCEGAVGETLELQLAGTVKPNRTVRSQFTPPERRFFKPDSLRAPSNPLNYRAFNIRTKMGVVRLCQRKGPERDGKRPKVGLSRGPGGSDDLPGMATFCGLIRSGKRMSRLGILAEGEDLWSNTLRRIFNNLRITQGAVDVAWRIPG
jgi:hypothetical protein